MSEIKEEILDVLAQICNIVPEQRFGQILFNYCTRFSRDNDTFYVYDETLLKTLKLELKKLKEVSK